MQKRGQHQKKRLIQQKKSYLWKQQKNDTATIETQGQIQDATSDKKRVMKQRKITYCDSKTTLLQQQNKNASEMQRQRKILMQQRNIAC